VLEVNNTFAMDDDDCAEAAGGMQQIVLNLLFAPTRDGTDGSLAVDGDESTGVTDAPAPLTFGDMVADAEGFAKAGQSAVDANVREVGEQEAEQYQRAASLLKTLPGLADEPIRLVTAVQLHLAYYFKARQQNELPFLANRAKSLHGLELDCIGYKHKSATDEF